MARVALYRRRSSLGERDKNASLEMQLELLQKWAEEQGHTVVADFEDPGERSYTLNRPSLNRLMLGAKDGAFDLVAVWRYDRFSRDQDQQGVARYQLKMSGVEVVSVTEPVPDGAVGTFLRNAYAFASQNEVEGIRLRLTGGRMKRIEHSKILTAGWPLYGYLWGDPEKGKRSYYVEDPETAWVVRLIFERVVGGMRMRQLAKSLEDDGIPTPGQILQKRGQLQRGKTCSSSWRLATLNRLLTNPAYMGRHSGWRTETIMQKRRHPITGEMVERAQKVVRADDNPDRVFFSEGVCPPLVSAETFGAAAVARARNTVESPRNRRGPKEVLLRNGIGRCGYCGRYLSAKWSKSGSCYRYNCASQHHPNPCEGGTFSWSAAELDTVTWDWVLHAFENPEVMRKKFERWMAERDLGRTVEHARREAVELAIADATDRKRNYMALAGGAADESMRGEYDGMAAQAAQDLKGFEAQREALLLTLGGQRSVDGVVESIAALGERAVEHLRTATYESKRLFLHAFNVQVLARRKGSREDQYKVGWGFDELYEAWVQKHFGFLTTNAPSWGRRSCSSS